jgi:hypothetical protein
LPRPRFFWAKCFAFLLSIVICISFNNSLLIITLRFKSQILVTLNPYLILCLVQWFVYIPPNQCDLV